MAKKTKISAAKKAEKKPKASVPTTAKREGRPTKYKPEYSEQAFKLCLLGLIDREIAKYFEVSESTFNGWKLEYPEFSESLKKGKVQADANVAASLYKQAMDGNVTAQIFILKNRHGRLWREKQTQVLDINANQQVIINKNYKK
ncbi:MAG: helix-turn-helix domain-containing protein [Bacteroidales bacterium]|jgi:hypothetical protein|nr:helix-turn-helix domain-containing protein [Bacteroidales bacterium]